MTSIAPDLVHSSVLVVGAGPVGLVAAAELARQGVIPRLIDALPEPTTQFRAVGVQPRSQEVLASLGALDRLRELSLPQVAIEIDAPRPHGIEQLARIGLTGVPTRYPMLLNLPQTRTETVLRERAAQLGVTVERGVTLTGLTMDETGVDVVLATPAGEEHTRVAWIVGADGGHSTVRAAVGSKLQGTFAGSHFILADVSVESEFARDTTRLFASTGGLTVMLCMLGNLTRLMFQVPDPGADAAPPTLDEVQRLATERMGPDVRLYDAQSITYYTIHHAQVPQYRVNRALLAGDAAHIHSPAAGQGMNTGMQDAANLAWKLALVCRGLVDSSILASYHAERHPIGADVVRRATLMANGMTLSGPAAWARDAALRVASHIEPIRRDLAEAITEVSVAYPHSSITGADGAGRHDSPHPGSHASDLAGLTSVGGDTLSIGDLLCEPGHLLLAQTTDRRLLRQLAAVLDPIGHVVPVASDPAGAPPEAIIDADSMIAEHYGIGRFGMALIRPDGYFGYLSTSADPNRLRSYLTTRLRVLRAIYA